MKTYTFTVTIEEPTSNNSFIDGIKNEIAIDKAQLALTHEVNKATSKTLKKVLDDFLQPINEELSKAGLGFTNHKDNIRSINLMDEHYYILPLPKTGYSYVIGIEGIPSKDLPTKYTTFTGEFRIKMRLNNCPCYTACQSDDMNRIKDADELYKTIKDRVKQEILASK